VKWLDAELLEMGVGVSLLPTVDDLLVRIIEAQAADAVGTRDGPSVLVRTR